MSGLRPAVTSDLPLLPRPEQNDDITSEKSVALTKLGIRMAVLWRGRSSAPPPDRMACDTDLASLSIIFVFMRGSKGDLHAPLFTRG